MLLYYLTGKRIALYTLFVLFTVSGLIIPKWGMQYLAWQQTLFSTYSPVALPLMDGVVIFAASVLIARLIQLPDNIRARHERLRGLTSHRLPRGIEYIVKLIKIDKDTEWTGDWQEIRVYVHKALERHGLGFNQQFTPHDGGKYLTSLGNPRVTVIEEISSSTTTKFTHGTAQSPILATLENGVLTLHSQVIGIRYVPPV